MTSAVWFPTVALTIAWHFVFAALSGQSVDQVPAFAAPASRAAGFADAAGGAPEAEGALSGSPISASGTIGWTIEFIFGPDWAQAPETNAVSAPPNNAMAEKCRMIHPRLNKLPVLFTLTFRNRKLCNDKKSVRIHKRERMYRKLGELAGMALLAAISAGAAPASAVDLAPPAYVNQLDNTNFAAQPQRGTNGSVYVDQLSPDARLVPQKKKSAARRVDTAREVKKHKLPDIGTGVSVALSRSERDSELPNVGRGVVR